MRIAFINVTYNQGSTGKIVRGLVDACKNAGHEVLVLYGRGPKWNGAVRVASPMDNCVDGLKSRLLDNQGFNSRIPTQRAIKLLKDFNPDVINFHNIHGYYFNLPLFFEYIATAFKGRAVWTLHDCWPFCGHCGYFSAVGCAKWKNGCGGCPLSHEYPKSWLADRSHKNWLLKRKMFERLSSERLVLITPSEWLRGFLKESILSKFVSKTIYNGIDVSATKPFYFEKQKIKKTGRKVILAVANVWEKRKGLSDVLELAKSLPRGFELRVAGTIANTRRLPRFDNVKYLGHLDSREDLYQQYLEADLLFNPSRDDNYPTVNLECICCGTPVLAYDIGGVKETIKRPSYGLAVSPGDNLLRSLETILNRPSFAVDFEDYSIEKMAQNYLDLFGHDVR